MRPAGVSPTMKRVALGTAIVGAVGVAMLLRRSDEPSARAAATPDTAAAPVTSSASREKTAASSRVDKVTKLATPEERARLAERISDAHAARAAAAPSAAPIPRLPASADDEPGLSTTQLRAAMQEVIPHLRDCYMAALPTLASPRFKLTADLKLTGDPDIGTIIDAKQLHDDTGQPLPAAFDDCMRSTMQLMALPPLAEGDQIVVRYPFEFRHD